METHHESEQEHKEQTQEVTMSKRQMKKAEKQKQRKLKDVLKQVNANNNTVIMDHSLQNATTKHARNGVVNVNKSVNDKNTGGVATADFPVQHTNDDSVLSKRSAVALDYFHDTFLRYFVKRPTRRSPLINRGYYLRMAVITDLVKSISTFLCYRLRNTLMTNHKLYDTAASTENLQEANKIKSSFGESEPIQIISIGAGFDTLAFRLGVEHNDDSIPSHQDINIPCTDNSKATDECFTTTTNNNKCMCSIKERCNIFCYDVDFPAVTMNKAACMAAAPHGTFPTSFVYELANPKHPIISKHYNVIGADLRAEDNSSDHWINCLLRECSVHSMFALHHPTLIYAECVTQYLPSDACDKLLTSIATHFPHAIFLSYDQIHPHDSFGKVMTHSLRQRRSPLLGIHEACHGKALISRAQRCGMYKSVFANFFDVAQTYICNEERNRINALEPFDEIEEWSEMCDHYGLTLSVTGNTSSPLPFDECVSLLSVPFYSIQCLQHVQSAPKKQYECCNEQQEKHKNGCETTEEIRVIRQNWPSGRFAFEGWGHGESWLEECVSTQAIHDTVNVSTTNTGSCYANNVNDGCNTHESVIISFGGFAATKEHKRVNNVFCHSLQNGELTCVDASHAITHNANVLSAPPLIFHTFTRIAPFTYLVLGGRSNPREINNRVFLLRCDVEQSVMTYVWCELASHVDVAVSGEEQDNCPSARYRHNTVLISASRNNITTTTSSNSNSHEVDAMVFVCGGKDKDGHVRNDAWRGMICINKKRITWERVHLHKTHTVTLHNSSSDPVGSSKNKITCENVIDGENLHIPGQDAHLSTAATIDDTYEKEVAFPGVYSAAAAAVHIPLPMHLTSALTIKEEVDAFYAELSNIKTTCTVILSGGLDENDLCDGNVWLIDPFTGRCQLLPHLNIGPRFSHTMTEIYLTSNSNSKLEESSYLMVIGGCIGVHNMNTICTNTTKEIHKEECITNKAQSQVDAEQEEMYKFGNTVTVINHNIKHSAVFIDLPNLSRTQWIELDTDACPSIARHACVPLHSSTGHQVIHHISDNKKIMNKSNNNNNEISSVTVAIIGGGYTCFSFGTFSTKPFLLHISMHSYGKNNECLIKAISENIEVREVEEDNATLSAPLLSSHDNSVVLASIANTTSTTPQGDTLVSVSETCNGNNNNNYKPVAPFTWTSLLSLPRPAVEELPYTPETFKRIAAEANRPVVFRNVNLGDCVNRWCEPEYMCNAEKDTVVSVHVAEGSILLDFVRKNFTFKHVRFAELIEHLVHATQTYKETKTLLPEVWYYRSIATHMKSERSNLWKDFSVLGNDFTLPTGAYEVIMPRVHQSCLRLNASPLQLWNHYDTFDNVLCQIVGNKRVVMFPPSQYNNLYMTGSSSSVMDIDAPDLIRYPRFIDACKYATEVIIRPGDMLYFPANWFHHITTLPQATECSNTNDNVSNSVKDKEPYSISVNVFYEHFAKDEYDPKDLYGNKDILACVALRKAVVDDVKHELGKATLHNNAEQKLPEEYSEFALREAIQDLEQLAESMSAARRAERKLSSKLN